MRSKGNINHDSILDLIYKVNHVTGSIDVYRLQYPFNDITIGMTQEKY
jgi:hypothetical protein